MKISPDETILYSGDFIVINNTLLYTWIVMGILITLALITNYSISKNKKNENIIGKLENFFETLILIVEDQVKKISKVEFKIVFPIIATFFLFILVSNLISTIPTFESPTASLSTTLALTTIVFILAVYVGVKNKGVKGFLQKYLKPSPALLPLNIISDITTTFSMSIRLYGNVMSGGVIAMILSKILFLSVGFPVLTGLLGTITSVIQAYIFSILAMIFIASSDN